MLLNWHVVQVNKLNIPIFLKSFLWAFYWDTTVERRQESTGRREGSGIGKGPRDVNRTRVAVSAVALCVNALTTRLLAPTIFLFLMFKSLNNLFYIFMIYLIISFLSTHTPTAVLTLSPFGKPWFNVTFNTLYDVDLKNVNIFSLSAVLYQYGMFNGKIKAS